MHTVSICWVWFQIIPYASMMIRLSQCYAIVNNFLLFFDKLFLSFDNSVKKRERKG